MCKYLDFVYIFIFQPGKKAAALPDALPCCLPPTEVRDLARKAAPNNIVYLLRTIIRTHTQYSNRLLPH